jgi:putative transposase
VAGKTIGPHLCYCVYGCYLLKDETRWTSKECGSISDDWSYTGWSQRCLGIWIAKSESSKYWLGILNELKNRGVNDVLIFAIDGLNGFSDAIGAVYPYAEVQRCIVHQLRNSLKYVSWKDRKDVAEDLKSIYKAVNEESAQEALTEFDDKWGKTYPHITASWSANWNELSTFYKYPAQIRRLIYTTNPIESLNSMIKKAIGNKGSFPSEVSAFKLLYLSVMEAQRKWTTRLRDWPEIYSQLSIFFKDTIRKYEN